MDNVFFRFDVFGVLLALTFFTYYSITRIIIQYNLFIGFFFTLYFIFSGIGASFLYDLSHPYIYYYLLGLAAVASGFVLSDKLFRLPRITLSFQGDFNFRFVVLLFVFFLLIIPLLYPEFKLWNLFIPKIKNIDDILMSGFVKTPFEVLIGYLTFLAFFFFSDIISRFKLTKQIIVVCLYLYFVFSQNGGLSRGAIVLSLMPLFIIFLSRKNYKVSTLLIYIVLLMIALVFFASYMTILRSGEVFSIDSLMTSLEYNIYIEFSFPRYFEKISNNFNSGNLIRFYSWLISLPIPKVIFPGKPVYNFNEEISTLLNGLTPGSSGYFVELSGIVNEGFYIAGNYLFYHLMICSSLIFYFIKIFRKNNGNSYMYLFYSLFIPFIVNRAGFTGFFASTLVPLLFYFIINYTLNFFKRN